VKERIMQRTVHETRQESVRILDLLAALLIGFGGYLHYSLYIKGYRAIPTIGTAFLLQVISSVIVAVALIVRLKFRLHVGPVAISAPTIARLAGIGLSVGTLTAFVLSRLPGGLFNFQERGLQPAPQSLLTILAEAAAVVLLVAALVFDGARHHVRAAELTVERPASRHQASV
jgi:hypothetical protein